MEIISDSPGLWQAGSIGICTEEHLGQNVSAVYIDVAEPLEEWPDVLRHYNQVRAKQGKFLSVGKGFPSDMHLLEVDRIRSAKLGFGLNIPLLIEMTARFVQAAEEIQHHFPVTETREYSLQADFEAYFHEVHSPLFQERILELRELASDSMDSEVKRVHLTFALQKNFETQASLLEILALSAARDASLSSALIPFAQTAKLLASANLEAVKPSFKDKMQNWVPLLRGFGWRPILIGTPEKLKPLLEEIYTL